jgi:hypothetical protein
MNSQLLYYILVGACVLMAIGIVYQLSRGKSVAGIRYEPEKPDPVPVLPPSHDQIFMKHVAPVFEDKLNKELTAKQAEALYNAYKGVKIEVKS